MASLTSHNPFRTPNVSPGSTGQPSTQPYAPPSGPPPRHPQQQQFAPPSTPHPPQQYAPPPNPPPSNSPSSPPRPAQQQYAPPPNPPPSNPSPPTLSPDPLGLTEDEPPAYTTRPDVYSGETTLEYGPTRPFQPVHQPRPAPAPQPQGPVQSLWQQLTGQFTGSSTTQFPPAHWSAYPGGQQQQQYAPPSNPNLPVNPQQQPQPPTTHLSEFARDFYATTAVPPGAFSDVSGARNNSSSDPGYPPPPGAQQYQPPAGLPPRTPSPARSPGGLPDDGRPTSTPVPGHPLLHNGNTLIYPPYHECHKCNNTGYKHADPSRPCHKCWNRYARPYIAAGAAASSSFPQAQRQRPLPRRYGAPSSSLYPGAAHGRAASASSLYPPPPPRPSSYPSSSSLAMYPSNANANGQYPSPQTVYTPGDARIGGTPCWRCSGRGTLSFLVFETMPCSVCRGVGRVFP
ncbi:hypothetical protein C8R45DRAFT_1134991 [Mycena sanguinolenta]|nr:hypothetical protein C8R45DRAFT_1134991 [Mycena sanguinolenta]